MKLQNIFKYAVSLALPLSLFGSCTGDFEELNTNPLEVDPGTLPFAAQFQEPMSFSYPCHQNLFQYWTNLHIDIFGGYFETPHTNFTNPRYNLNVGHCGGMYENFMLRIFNNTRRLIRQCDSEGKKDFAAAMRIVQVYNLLNTTDTYGPMAYSSVLAADAMPQKPSSYAYDKQEDIYKAMFADLDTAIKDLDMETPGMASFDIWCGGDRALWKRVANQLKLRMAIRIVKVDPTNAQKYAVEAIAGGVLEDKDILISKGFENEMWLMFDWMDIGANASLVTMLKGMKDPRLGLYLTKNTRPIVKTDAKPLMVNGQEQKDINGFTVYAEADYIHKPGTAYVGIPTGCDLGNKNTNKQMAYGNCSGWAGTFSMPQPIMKAAEGWFLRAEAKLRWGIGTMAVKVLYEEGVKRSIKNEYAYRKPFAETAYSSHKQTLPANWANLADDATINAYLTSETPQENYVDANNSEFNSTALNMLGAKWTEGSNEEQLQQIITQKWIANYPLSTEAWAEWRRTGYPKLFTVKVNESGGKVVTAEGCRRLPYNETQHNANTSEYMKGVQMLDAENPSATVKGDFGGNRVWWDRKDKANF